MLTVTSLYQPGTRYRLGFASLKNKGLVGLINLYADPSQVCHEPYFWEAMEQLVSFSQPTELVTIACSPLVEAESGTHH